MNLALVQETVFFVIACLALVFFGSLLVRNLSVIARFLRLTEFVAAFIFVSFATSLPELFIGVNSAINHSSILSLGNVLGSNIVNLTLLLGIPVLLAREIKAPSKIVRRDALYMFLMSLLPLILMIIGRKLSRIDGLILIVVFLVYFWQVITKSERFVKKWTNGIKRVRIVLAVVFFILGFVGLLISSHFVVKYAVSLALQFLIPPILVGLFLISFGTSLPELVFRTRAAITKHEEMTLGNVIGSNIINISLVLGVTALIYPIEGNFLLFLIAGSFMVVVSFLFLTFIESEDKITWKEGLSMILLYVFFIIIELYFQRISGL